MPILDDLKTYGYSVQRNAVPQQTCERFAARLDEIEAHKRNNGTLYDVGIQAVIYNLFEEDTDLFLQLIDGEPVFPVVQQILGNGQQITLNSLSASRSIHVNHEPDGDLWKAHIDARMPAPDFGHTESIVAMTCLDDFTAASGATRLWPYSHLSGSRPASRCRYRHFTGSWSGRSAARISNLLARSDVACNQQETVGR